MKYTENERNVSFSVEKVWQSYRQKDDCGWNDEAEWVEGVQQHYDGCRKVTWKFQGPAYNIADSVLHAFEIYLKKLIFLSNSDSAVLNSSSKAILVALSKCSKLNKSSLNIIIESHNVLPGLVKEHNETVKKLSKYIGNLTLSVVDAHNDFGFTFTKYMKEFVDSGKTGFKKQIDYEPVLRQLQKLMNTVALIAETSLNDCRVSTTQVYESVTVLTLIYGYFAISVQGINSCVQDVLYEQKITISPTIASCSVPLKLVVEEVIKSIDSVTLPLNESPPLLINLVNNTIFLNDEWSENLGSFKGVPITVGDIVQNF